MEGELESLSGAISTENGTYTDRYINNQPESSLFFGLSTPVIIGIIIFIIAVIIIIIIICCCCCCCDDDENQRERPRRNHSDTSNFS